MGDASTVCYVICSVPRTGSSLVAQALRDMGVGAPQEYFNLLRVVGRSRLTPREEFAHCRTADDVRAYAAHLRQKCAVGNVFGVKLHYSQLRAAPGLLEGLTAYFPGARFLALSRRDLLRQAISLVRASQTAQWSSDLPARRAPWFDREAIDAAAADVAGQARSWECFFAARGLRPFRVVYEDLDRDYYGVMQGVLAFLGIRGRPVPPPPLRRQADALTEEWVARYRASRAAAA
jgi:LPS sulfotransferase NodH